MSKSRAPQHEVQKARDVADRAIAARDRSMQMARDGFCPAVGTVFRLVDSHQREEMVTIKSNLLSHAGFNGMEIWVAGADGYTMMVCIGNLYTVSK